MFKKFLGLFFIITFCCLNCNADLIIDDSIHSDIANKYELDKLPDLPSNLKDTTIDDIFTPNEFETKPTSKYTPPSDNTNPTASAPDNTPPKQTITTPPQQNEYNKKQYKDIVYDNNTMAKIKTGKKFSVVNTTALSDRLGKGSTVTFVSTKAETTKYITIPKGTVFYGTVMDSHTPKITGNGGLLVIRVNKLIYKNKSYNIKAKITIADQKHIFFNNIKGERRFWKNAKKSGTNGKKYFDRMYAKARIYYVIPGVEKAVAPIALITGSVVYAFDVVSSPIMAIFSKGDRLVIPKNSYFEIKMLEEAVIYK